MVVGSSVFASLGDRNHSFQQIIKESMMDHGASAPGHPAPVTDVDGLLLKNDFEQDSFQLANDLGETSVAVVPCVPVSMTSLTACKD